jgi:hypothetical protein
VLCNAANSGPNNLSRKVADVVLEKRLAPAPARPASGTAVSASAERQARISGVYLRRGVDEVFEVAPKNGKLLLLPYELPINHVAADTFATDVFPVTLLTDGPPGPAAVMRIKISTEPEVQYDRVPGFKPSRTDLDAFTGTYYSDELDVRYTIERKDSVLAVTMRRRGSLTLQPAFTDGFTSADIGTLRFTREKGRVTGFRVTSGRVRNVIFTKVPG